MQLPSEKEKILRFQHYERKERVPFVVYADFQCLLEDIEQQLMDRCRTYEYQHHRAYSVGYYVYYSDDQSLCGYRAYGSDIDCMQWFVRELREFANVACSCLYDTVNEAPVEEFSRGDCVPCVRGTL